MNNILDQTANVFEFIKNSEKLNLLIKANEMLNINKIQSGIIVFVYSAPKVGSTSIVSSLRIFGSNKLNIIHIHDETMLNVLGHIKDISINELILFNKYLGKTVYVIDVYRSPIERKISAFFEKIGNYHFNNIDAEVNNYNVFKIIKRFNNIFPYLGNGDHFIDKYNIPIPEHFDYNNKYLLVDYQGIKYIKLRLKDSNIWGNILTNIFGFNIQIVKDYESDNKPIKNLFMQFKFNYRIPTNFLNDIINCKYLKYYYSEEEIKIYYTEWLNKSTDIFLPYNPDQYKVYEDITIENSHIDYIQFNHYIDEGCLCKACEIKRVRLASKILSENQINERIVHEEAKTELLQNRVNRVNKINQAIYNLPIKKKLRGKNFGKEMASIVKGYKF